jgi:hypothetical protein
VKIFIKNATVSIINTFSIFISNKLSEKIIDCIRQVNNNNISKLFLQLYILDYAFNYPDNLTYLSFLPCETIKGYAVSLTKKDFKFCMLDFPTAIKVVITTLIVSTC